jgi:hypothetical protein
MRTAALRTERSNAVSAGVLYLAATLSGVLAAVALGGLASDPQALAGLAAGKARVLMAVFFELVMAVTVAGVAFAIFPVLWGDAHTQGRRSLAVWYVGSRVTEGAVFLIGILGLLSLLTLALTVADSGATPALYLPIAAALMAFYEYSFVLGQTVFCVGAVMLYALLYQSRRVPRWLSAWGLIAAPLMLIAGFLLPFTGDPTSTVSSVLYAPLALQEMVLAIWLIARGFAAPQPEVSR